MAIQGTGSVEATEFMAWLSHWVIGVQKEWDEIPPEVQREYLGDMVAALAKANRAMQEMQEWVFEAGDIFDIVESILRDLDGASGAQRDDPDIPYAYVDTRGWDIRSSLERIEKWNSMEWQGK